MDRRSFLKTCAVAGMAAYFGPPKPVPKIFSVTYDPRRMAIAINKNFYLTHWTTKAAEALAKSIDEMLIQEIIQGKIA